MVSGIKIQWQIIGRVHWKQNPEAFIAEMNVCFRLFPEISSQNLAYISFLIGIVVMILAYAIKYLNKKSNSLETKSRMNNELST